MSAVSQALRSALLLCLLFAVMSACKEQGRYELEADDKTPPGAPVIIDWEPVYGGAVIYFQAPDDEDVLSVDAEYTNSSGRQFHFAATNFATSVSVFGMGDTNPHTIYLYATDRAGNRSKAIPIVVIPLEPVVEQVVRTVTVKPGFSTFIVEWINGFMVPVNVFVNFKYNHNGTAKDITTIYTSESDTLRVFSEDLPLVNNEEIAISVHIEDTYGNKSQTVDLGKITLLIDEEISKENWTLPDQGYAMGGVGQVYGNWVEGKNRYAIDGIVDAALLYNYLHTNSKGKTGNSADGNLPWNLLIDLGDYYELSRVITHQRHSGADMITRGHYFMDENVGVYNMYIWDEELQEWEFVSQRIIPIPNVSNIVTMIQEAQKGDYAYCYPEMPAFTKPTRWFRYEAVAGFANGYTSLMANCLSEITLRGRKAANR